MRLFRETLISIILTQKNSIFCPRSKHSIRFIHTLRHKVVNQNSYIGLIASQDKRRFISYKQCSINTCNQTLSSCFLITGCTINLTGKEKTWKIFQFQRRFQLQRIKIIIFDSISWPENLNIFKSFNSLQCLNLDIKRQGRRKSLKIVLIRISSLRFKKQLMGILIGECSQLILYTRTIARPFAVNKSGK